MFLPREFHGQRSLESYSPCSHKELDTTEHTHISQGINQLILFYFLYLACIFCIMNMSIMQIHTHIHIYRRRRWHPTPVLLPGISHGLRSLVGCSPWGCKQSDTTEQLHFNFPLSCVGEGNGNPLQCSCLENPRDGGAWWAAIYGVAQSWTRLKRLSSSSSSIHIYVHDESERGE